ncbi:Increased rDNA silencing protein [Sporothrix epigloea]|uniref:Increased rDNA silencing protein n=1 Tax=Sporothrix epigloea TaxID=1892477 RepID=A0ABP0D4Y2_9PEZI
MGGPGGSSAGTDTAGANAAALRGAALAFGRQKNAVQQQQMPNQPTKVQQAQKTQPQPQHTPHLQPPTSNPLHRQPSLSPSRSGALSSGHSASALLAATSAAASSSRDTSAGRTDTIHSAHGGPSSWRPVSPKKLSLASGNGGRSRSHSNSTSNSRNSSNLCRSRSRDTNTRDDRADSDLIPTAGRSVLPQPAVERMQASGVRAVAPPHHVRQSSFLAANLAASQAASPRITPSHTGGGNVASTPVPTHLSAALLAAAASDRRQKEAKVATAASLAAAAAASSEEMIRHGIYIDGRVPLLDEDVGDGADANAPDTLAIPATSALVSIFEKKQNRDGNAETTAQSPARPPSQIAFTPPRSETAKLRGASAVSKAEPVASPHVVPLASPSTAGKLKQAPKDLSSSKLGQSSSQNLHAAADIMVQPAPPKPRPKKPSAADSPDFAKEGETARGNPLHVTSSTRRGPRPVVPPSRSATALVARHTGDAPLERRWSSATLATAKTTATALDGLPSAIMAGSLAAARHPTFSQASSMVRPPLLSLPSSRSHTPLARSTRSTSPVKRTTMLQTLRRDRVHSDDDDYDRDGTSSGNTQYRRSHYHRDGRLRQGKHHLLHATPAALVGGGRHRHNHHEGARRRWREAVSDRQRRRYEAVWASNRGSRGFRPADGNDFNMETAAASDDDDTVPNIVVRDIWRRSRLPMDELAEVWELVDETGNGRLGKAAFVVGLWLIDQRLRGRKLPARVSDSVWTSARGMQAPKPRKR